MLWSLGNLFFGTQGRFGHDKMQPGYGLLARMVLKDAAIDRIELLAIRINNRLQDYQPRACDRADAERVLAGMAKHYLPEAVAEAARAEGREPTNPYFHVDERGIGILRLTAAEAPASARSSGH